MRLALAMMFQNEKPFLALHLPVVTSALTLDGFIALDGGSTDGSADVVRSFGGVVFERTFDWNFGLHGNALIEYCEESGYDALLRLDPDEAMFAGDIGQVKELLEQGWPGVRLPRYHFIGDRLHYNPRTYPDFQYRAWRLRCGVRYQRRLHEMPVTPETARQWCTARGHIYHYEGLRPNDARRFLKFHNFNLMSQGLPPLLELPAGFVVPQGFNILPSAPFNGAQPLDPAIVSGRAPFEEEQP